MAHSDSTASKPFRVIIVGAGIVGVALSHAFQLANIDHIVLEKHKEIVSPNGSALMLWPNGARIVDQFGILPKIKACGRPIQNEYRRWPDGSIQSIGKTCATMTETFGTESLLFDRPKFLTGLYNNLPDTSRIHLNKRVAQIEHTDTGVRVILSDNSVEEGDMVIGADGVHSVVKSMMWDYASKFEPDVVPESDKSAMITEFCTFFGVSELKDDSYGLGSSDTNFIYGQNSSRLLFTESPTKVFWGVTFKDDISQELLKRKANEKDMETLAKRFADIQFTEKLKLSDFWETRTREGLLNIEEGIISRWHAGRIVLVGDSVHKMTTDLGIGANIALESAVSLCNILHRELKSKPNRRFSQSELSTMFSEYQNERYKRAKVFVELSGKVTRLISWQTRFAKFFVTYVAPYVQNIQIQKFVDTFSEAPKLDFAPLHTVDGNSKGWKAGEKKKEKKKESTNVPWFIYVLLSSTVGVALAYFTKERLPALL